MSFRWKLILSFASFSILLFILQRVFAGFFNLSPLSSFFLGLVILLPLAYWTSVTLVRPIRRITEKATQLASEGLGEAAHIYSGHELGSLSKAIDEMGFQLRKRIDEISKERDYLETILKGMMEGVLMVDGRGRILMVNQALRNLLSLPSDVINRMPLEIIRNAELEGAIRQVIRQGKGMAFELDLPSSGGKTFEVNVVGISSPGQTGKIGEEIIGAIAVFHDITRLKELEKIRKDFVANVSHELRTPLTTIKGYAETLLEGALKEEVASQFIQVINRHADRLTKIVEDLLMLSKIESKELFLKKEVISVSELIHDVLDYVREGAEKRKISISLSEVPSSLSVNADRGHLEQVLINLLDNAVKYNREGGTILISAFRADPKEVRFSIKDSGIGIPEEDLPRIFERFYRVDKGRSQEIGGTGLGLSIVKHIVHAYGGRVWADTQMGAGSTFYFTLPTETKPLM